MLQQEQTIDLPAAQRWIITNDRSGQLQSPSNMQLREESRQSDIH